MDNYQKYNFSPEEIMIIAITAKNTQNSNIAEKVIKDREKYNFNSINTVEFFDALGQEELKKIIQNVHKYNISNFELANLISLTKDEEFIKNWIDENRLSYDFNDEELFIMLLASKDEKQIQDFMNQNNEKNKDIEEITLPDNMSIGIEIESEGKNSYAILQLQEIYKGWNAKDEISLKNGVEIVSPVLYGNKSTREIYTVCERLNIAGQQISENCGGHIHIGASYLTSVQSYKNLIDLWTNTEKIMYLISNEAGKLPREKIDLYAPPISKEIETALNEGNIDLENEEDLKEFTKKLVQIQIEGKKSSDKYINERYYGINFTNINKTSKNTIEFRLANGSVDPEVIVKNINLFGGIVNAAEELYIIQTLDECDRTEEQKEKLLFFNTIINDDSNNELLKLEALLKLTISEDKNYYLNRYMTNINLLDERNVEVKQMIDEIPKRGTKLSSKYFNKVSENMEGIEIKQTEEKIYDDIERVEENIKNN